MSSSSPRAPRRADAQRNVERILDAAVACLGARQHATMSEIASTAGLGRVTVYGHFSSRADLIDAVVNRILAQGDAALELVELDGDPRDALTRLIHSSWHLVDQSRSILAAAQDELSPARIRELHAGPAQRVEALVERGRELGVFRVDLPTSWLVAVLHQVLHGAAEEISAGQLTAEDAPKVICTTILAVYESDRGDPAT